MTMKTKKPLIQLIFNQQLSSKLITSYLLIGVAATMSISIIFYQNFKQAILERTFEQLKSINILKKTQIELYLQTANATFPLSENSPEKKDIQEILYERTGMGETGESYLVDKSYTMQTKSRFFPEKKPQEIKVKTAGAINAYNSGKGHAIIEDYRGVKVLSVYSRLEIPGMDWALLSEMDLNEAMVPVIKVRNKIIWVSIVVLLGITLFTLIVSRRITSPVKELKKVMQKLSKGILPKHELKRISDDEIGQITSAMNALVKALQKTASFAHDIGAGNFKADYQLLSNSDELGKALVQMRDQLIDLNVQKTQLERQSKRFLVEGQENERIRISRELHDGIGPLLTTLKLYLSQSGKADESLKKLIDETISEVRRISDNLMPAVLLDYGIGAELDSYIKSVAEKTRLNFNYVNEIIDNEKVPVEVSIALYRIAQEAINNILKHAEATNVKVSVTQFDDRLSFFIQDDGEGFNLSNYRYEKNTSNGLRNMKERTALLNGEFFINSTSKGTTIEVEIPLS